MAGLRNTEREARIRSDLKNSIKDGCAYSVMVGIGESYLAAFMLALGFSQLSSALITTLPLFAGAILQLVSPWGVRWLGSYSRWVVASACAQAASFVIFVAAALHRGFPEWTIYAAASIYWGASLATGPAWNTWIAALIPAKIRTDFFSRRSRLTYASTLLGLMAGGLLLQVGRARGLEMQAFIFVFMAAALLRFASAYYLSLHSEPEGLARSIKILSFRETTAKIRSHGYGRILVYLFFLQFAIQVSSGFFTPYMLKQLHLEYWAYMALVGALVFTKVLTMPLTLRLIKSFGLKRVLVAAAVGIAVLPVSWLWSDAFGYLLLIQIVGGFVWGAHELSSFLILFGEIPETDRTSVLTEFNLFHTTGLVMGAIAGGAVFNNLGQNYHAYAAIFFLSTLLRIVCVFVIPDVGRPIKKAGLRIYYRTLGVRPGAGGGITRPIIADANANAALPIVPSTTGGGPAEPAPKSP